MSRVDVDNLMDGMVLGQDVLDPDRGVLIPAGSVLSQKHRVVLASARIPFVEITDESAGLAELLFDAGPRTRRLEKESLPVVPIRDERPKPASRGGTSAKARQARSAGADAALVQRRLVMLAHMFGEFKDDPIMRKLCRLAIKCAKEGLIGA